MDINGVKGAPDPAKWTGVYKYDTDSLLLEGTDARGVKTAFTYDGLNRVKTVVYTGETGYQTPTVTYTYDETETGFYNNGRLTKVQTAVNATYGTPETIQSYRYDKVGQAVKHVQSIDNQSYQLEYTYNLAGQLTSEKYPSVKVVNMAAVAAFLAVETSCSGKPLETRVLAVAAEQAAGKRPLRQTTIRQGPVALLRRKWKSTINVEKR